jgi:hypothetical protein
MKLFQLVKSFLIEYKAIAIGIAVIFSVGLGGILISPASTQYKPETLGEQTKNESTEPVDETVTEDQDTGNVTTTKSPTQATTKTPTPTKTQTTYSSTNTPTSVPYTPTQSPAQAPNYVINGVTFSSLYPTITLKAGEQKTLFTMTAVGNKNFVIDDFRLLNSTGLGLTEMSGSIMNGQTKEIVLKANPDATPGTYSGFIGVVIDGVYGDQKLRPTVIIEGGSSNGQTLNVTGPTAGSTYNQGDSITITWEATNISGDFYLSVQGNNGDTYNFATVANSQRSYTWTAQKYQFAPNATHFRFSVTGGNLIDHSDGDIIINN